MFHLKTWKLKISQTTDTIWSLTSSDFCFLDTLYEFRVPGCLGRFKLPVDFTIGLENTDADWDMCTECPFLGLERTTDVLGLPEDLRICEKLETDWTFSVDLLDRIPDVVVGWYTLPILFEIELDLFRSEADLFFTILSVLPSQMGWATTMSSGDKGSSSGENSFSMVESSLLTMP